MSEFEKDLASNRKARHNYLILERFEAGIILTGTEVKSARAGKVTLKDSYAKVRGEELWLVGVHISPYTHGNIHNHEPERERKLLVHKRHIHKLMGEITRGGLTVVPLRVYLKGGRIKVEMATAKGKKQHDKRDAKRAQQLDREAQAAMSHKRD